MTTYWEASDIIATRRSEWQASLRSGEYPQGQGRLATINPDGSEEYCCLGVACETNMAALNLTRESDTYHVIYRLADGEALSASFDEDQLAYYGLTDEQQSILMTANDNGVSFDAIASIISVMDITVPESAYDIDNR